MRILIFAAVWLVVGEVAAQQALNVQTADEVFRHGVDLLAHQQYGAARHVFARFSAQYPNDVRKPEADYQAAFCAVNLYHADGERQMETFIRSYPDHPRSATANFELASLFYQQKNYNKAITYFSKTQFRLLTAEQQNTGHFRWGYSLFSQKKLSEALDQFNFTKAQGGNYGPASSYYAGYIEYSQQDYANALIDLKRAELSPAYATVVPIYVAQVLFKQGKNDEVIAYYQQVKNREGVNQVEEIALLASEVYFRKGDYTAALPGYQVYLDDHKSADRAVLYRAGYSALKAEQDETAIGYLKRAALGADSVANYASYLLGSLYLKSNQKPLALAGFEMARKFKADKVLAEEASFQYAKIAYDLGRSDQAIDELENFITTYTTSDRLAEVKEILSHAYINANNYNKAIEYIESLSRRGPSLDRAYQKATYLKGTELFNMERYPEAIAMWEKSVQYPIDAALAAEAHFWCGEAYSIGRRYELAIDHYAPLLSPNATVSPSLLSKARYGLGYAFYNTQQYDRALFNFREFVNKTAKADANYPDGLLRLADCQYVSKQYNEALATYRQVLQTASPDKDYAHLQAGVILGIQRKYSEATDALTQVVKNFPQSGYREEAYFQLAQLDFEQGKYAQAVTGYGRVIETSASSRFVPYAYMRRAASYYNLKEYDKTANDYMTVVDKYPTHPVVKDALLPLQEALGLAGRSSEFEDYLARFKNANPDVKGIESIEFETASNLFFNQEYGRAIQRFTDYQRSYPESPRLAEARYYQAESYYRLKDYDRALEVYLTVADESAFSMLSRVVARVAELEFRKGRFDVALNYFGRLVHLSNNKKEQYTAWSGLMESHYLLAQYDSADVYARIILEKGNINAGAVNKASLYLGKTAMARGDYETAKDEFLNTLNTARDEFGAEAKYLLAEIFYLSKDHKTSNETLFSLISDFAAYQEWVGRAFLLLADNYLAMGDNFQARATLKSIIDNNFPLIHIRDLAAEKLKKLDSELQQQVEKDTTDNQ
ncbi:MAG: tetratricopeptide repeat protein [Bacteroidota bacterium]